MPIVDGRYEMCIGKTYSKVDKGVEDIKRKVQKSRNIRINGVPMWLLRDLRPLLEKKDVKMILPLGAKRDEELAKLGAVAVTKGRIYHMYDDKEVCTGSIMFPDSVYTVIWDADRIIAISTLEYSKCVKCMKGAFDVGWRYARK